MKVAIIGAGVTGLYLAWKLSQKGHKVTVFEKKEKIGKEACSGLFSERILEFIPESQKLIQNQIEYCLIHFPKRTLKIKFFNPVGNRRFSFGAGKFFVMSHFKLDNLIARLAEDSGVKIILKHNILDSESDRFRDNFDRIIGCDGANSTIRENLNLPTPVYRLAIQGFISQNDSSNPEAEPSAHYGAGYVETWPTLGGFIWKIPRGNEIEYGIIGNLTQAKKLFDKFLKENNLYLEKINSGIIPQGLIIPKNLSITLCGDAAGLTKPWSGGGVIWGLTAAEILLKNFPDFLKYQKELKRFFLPQIIFSKIATKMVYFFGFNFPWIFPKSIKIEGDFLI